MIGPSYFFFFIAFCFQSPDLHLEIPSISAQWRKAIYNTLFSDTLYLLYSWLLILKLKHFFKNEHFSTGCLIAYLKTPGSHSQPPLCQMKTSLRVTSHSNFNTNIMYIPHLVVLALKWNYHPHQHSSFY